MSCIIRNKRCLLRLILIVLIVLWCIFIFTMSSENGLLSSSRSEGLVVKLINRFLVIFGIDSSDCAIVDYIEVFMRKGAHVFVFFVLSVLSSIFAYTYDTRDEFRLLGSFLFSYIYASSDEIHQIYVPGRAGSIKDVLIDTIGISLGLMLVWLFARIYKRPSKKVTK